MSCKYRLVQVVYQDETCKIPCNIYLIQKRKLFGGWKVIFSWDSLQYTLREFYRITGYKSDDDKVIIEF